MTSVPSASQPFALGDQTVTIQIRDSSNNVANCSFVLSVVAATTAASSSTTSSTSSLSTATSSTSSQVVTGGVVTTSPNTVVPTTNSDADAVLTSQPASEYLGTYGRAVQLKCNVSLVVQDQHEIVWHRNSVLVCHRAVSHSCLFHCFSSLWLQVEESATYAIVSTSSLLWIASSLFIESPDPALVHGSYTFVVFSVNVSSLSCGLQMFRATRNHNLAAIITKPHHPS